MAEFIATALGGKRAGRGFMARCPAHEDRAPSLSVTEKNGKVLVNCHAGCEQAAVISALRQLGLWKGKDHAPPVPPVHAQPCRLPHIDAFKRNLIARLWTESSAVSRGDPAWAYLVARGLPPEAFASVRSLRFHPSVDYFDDCSVKLGTFPCLLGLVQAPNGGIAALHRTYLTQDGQKAFGAQSRKLLTAYDGALKGAAIRLFEPSDVLAIGEGVETMLAVYALSGKPVWSALNAHGMEYVVIPTTVQTVFIAADKDLSGTGERAANALAGRLLREGRQVFVSIPDESISGKGVDWLDILVRKDFNDNFTSSPVRP